MHVDALPSTLRLHLSNLAVKPRAWLVLMLEHCGRQEAGKGRGSGRKGCVLHPLGAKIFTSYCGCSGFSQEPPSGTGWPPRSVPNLLLAQPWVSGSFLRPQAGGYGEILFLGSCFPPWGFSSGYPGFACTWGLLAQLFNTGCFLFTSGHFL